jgi:hypothetical protein
MVLKLREILDKDLRRPHFRLKADGVALVVPLPECWFCYASHKGIEMFEELLRIKFKQEQIFQKAIVTFEQASTGGMKAISALTDNAVFVQDVLAQPMIPQPA